MKIKIPKLLELTTPRWVKKMRTRKTFDELSSTCNIDGKDLSINKFECCVVGETLDLFDNSFKEFCDKREGKMERREIENEFHNGCKECVTFSHVFNRIIQYEQPIEELEKELALFAKHIKKAHPEIVERTKK